MVCDVCGLEQVPSIADFVDYPDLQLEEMTYWGEWGELVVHDGWVPVSPQYCQCPKENDVTVPLTGGWRECWQS